MELGASFVDGAIHLALFIAAGLVLGAGALALLERMSPGRPRVVRTAHLAGAVLLFVLLAAAERIYHSL
ncbi:MAG TPA: hypothetical protein VNE62_11975 [Actinomycetota bacterium]|nr:hypothetical protein [Actinomycetota bacterium]